MLASQLTINDDSSFELGLLAYFSKAGNRFWWPNKCQHASVPVAYYGRADLSSSAEGMAKQGAAGSGPPSGKGAARSGPPSGNALASMVKQSAADGPPSGNALVTQTNVVGDSGDRACSGRVTDSSPPAKPGTLEGNGKGKAREYLCLEARPVPARLQEG